MNFKFLFFSIFLFTISSASALSIEKGFEALKIYNYFEAKRIFEKKLKKEESPASFGLAIIYYRKDNPFHNLDSAFNFVLRSESKFNSYDSKKKDKLNKFQFNELQILELKRNISSFFYKEVEKQNTEIAYQHFLDKHPWALERYVAISKRDSIAFYQAMIENTSKSFQDFLSKYPGSEFSDLAKKEVELKDFKENTKDGTLEEYMSFVEKYPKNPFFREAEHQIYLLQTKLNTVESYKQFIENFPLNSYIDQAWRKLFQTYMYDYSDERIQAFKTEFPNYPFQNEIEEEINLLSQKLLPFKSEKYYGWMDEKGNRKSEANYESLNLYREGLALASRVGKIGFIDKNNKVVIPFEFDEASDFEDGRATVEKNEKVGIIDRTGKIVFDIVFEDIGVFSEGLVYAKRDSLYAYYDKYGTQIISEGFDEAFSFSGGIALVSVGDYQNYIDKVGTYLFPMKYHQVQKLTSELFVFKFNDLFGIININGKIVQDPKFDEIAGLSEDRIAFVLNGKIGYFDQFGKQVVAPIFDQMPNFAKHASLVGGYAKAVLKGKYGVIDKNGNWIVPASHQNLGEISDILAFQKNNMWGYINLMNKQIIPPSYDEANSFENDAAIVSFSERFGMINSKGIVILPIIFDKIKKLNDRFYVSIVGGKQSLVFKDGSILTTENYSQIRLLNKDYILLYSDNYVHYFLMSEMRIIKEN